MGRWRLWNTLRGPDVGKSVSVGPAGLDTREEVR